MPSEAGVIRRCRKCGHTKKPLGRSAPLGTHYCDDDCDGYREPPTPGDLWPGETREEFGFPGPKWGDDPDAE